MSFLVYALIFVTAVSQTTIVPLLPVVAHRYGLRASELAWVLTLPSVAMLVTSAPVGLLGDRLGSRRVTLAGGVVLALSVFAQGIPSLPVLVVGRLLFGIGYGALWTTGLAWLSGLQPGGSSRRMGATVTASAIGSTVGPTLAGVLASRFGFSVPFAVAGAVTAAVAAALVATPSREREPGPVSCRKGEVQQPGPVAGRVSTLRTLRRPNVLAGALTLALSGGTSALMQLLVPLQLHSAGRSSQTIGLALSAGAVVYIVVSALSVHLGPRVTNLRTNAGMAAILAVALVPALVGNTTGWVVAAYLATVLPRAVTGTVAYALATGDREEGGPGTSTVLGLLNGLWAVATVIATVAAGALKTAFDARTAYAAATLVVAAVAVWLVRAAWVTSPAGTRSHGRLRRPSRAVPVAPTVPAPAVPGDLPAVELHPPTDRTPTGQIPVPG